jgi:hypothetical protein
MIRSTLVFLSLLLLAVTLPGQTVSIGTTSSEQARWEVSHAQLETLAAAAESYRQKNGSYPKTHDAEEFAALVGAAVNANDGWGSGLQLFSAPGWFFIRSAGPDQVSGTADDLVARDRTHAELNAIAMMAEVERTGHGVYPESLVKASAIRDQWGSPYRYEVQGHGAGFVVTSAGADRQFGSADDVSAPDATTADLRSISTALNAYLSDSQPLPSDFSAVVSVIQPRYIRQSPRVDVWGTQFDYHRSEDAKSFTLTSAGPDRKFGTADDLRTAR